MGQTGRNANTRSDSTFGGRRFRDSRPGGNGIVDLHKSIVVSSDTYYYILAHDMGVDAIHDYMKPFGFGQLTGIDVMVKSKGCSHPLL